jgi:hypothetical protein
MSLWKIILIILVAIVVAIGLILIYSGRNFKHMTDKAIGQLLTNSHIMIAPAMMDSCPPVIRKWLTRSGITNKPYAACIHLNQIGEMRTIKNGKWMKVKADQWFNASQPGFVWSADVTIAKGLYLTGRDSYINGKGHMLIKLLSVVPVANAHGYETDQGSMLRYLAEIAWFPYAALSSYIKWVQQDAQSAIATISYGGISASALFRFNNEGDFVSLEAKRYYNARGSQTLEDWIVRVVPGAYQTFDGIHVPDKLNVTWNLKNDPFTWFRLQVTDINYHPIK